jgi:UDP-N-acetylmuramate--alanine ligase
MGIGWTTIRDALLGFSGVTRRFQLLGEASGVSVVDDYAHHPTEIEAAISTARSAYPQARLVVVFQPHLYTRTRDFTKEFGRALSAADVVWVTGIYPAREPPIPGVDGELVAQAVRATGGGRDGGPPEVHVHSDLPSLADELSRYLRTGDLCLTVGAGSIETVAPEVLAKLGGSSLGGAHV